MTWNINLLISAKVSKFTFPLVKLAYNKLLESRLCSSTCQFNPGRDEKMKVKVNQFLFAVVAEDRRTREVKMK